MTNLSATTRKERARWLAATAPSLSRVIWGAVAAVLVLPLVTVLVTKVTSSAPLTWALPCFLLTVIVVAAIGGLFVGIPAAIVATGLVNFYFVPPTHTLSVARASDYVTLITFLTFSSTASALVALFERRSQLAQQARAEATLLSRAAATVALNPEDLEPVFAAFATEFNLAEVALIHRSTGERLVSARSQRHTAIRHDETQTIAVDDDHELVMRGEVNTRALLALVVPFSNQLAQGLAAQRAARERAALKALSDAEDLRTALLRSVSHDLRTPLATISANVSSLLAEDVEWSAREHRQFLLGIEREVQRLTSLITNLLDLGRIEAGVIQPHLELVDLDAVLAAALETIDLRGRSLTFSLDEDLPQFTSDPALLERVVANIVANACSASPEDQPVMISGRVTPGFVNLYVEDHGPGLSDIQVEGALRAFEQLHPTDRGTGLGLTVAQGLVTALDGDLVFTPTPGGGLTVRIGIPLKKQTS